MGQVLEEHSNCELQGSLKEVGFYLMHKTGSHLPVIGCRSSHKLFYFDQRKSRDEAKLKSPFSEAVFKAAVRSFNPVMEQIHTGTFS